MKKKKKKATCKPLTKATAKKVLKSTYAALYEMSCHIIDQHFETLPDSPIEHIKEMVSYLEAQYLKDTKGKK